MYKHGDIHKYHMDKSIRTSEEIYQRKPTAKEHFKSSSYKSFTTSVAKQCNKIRSCCAAIHVQGQGKRH